MFLALTIPANFITDLGASIGETFENLWPLLILVAGIPIGFYVLNKIRAFATVGARGGRRG